jgi:hypothetical protein
MNPFRRSREFALYRQLVFGARADVPERHDLEFAAHESREAPSAQACGDAHDDDATGNAASENA